MTSSVYTEYRELAVRVFQEVTANRADIVGAYISGSVATGHLTAESDLDLTLISSCEKSVVRSFNYRDGRPIDLQIRPLDDYSEERLKDTDPSTAMGLYFGIPVKDENGILEEAKAFFDRNIFGPTYQGRWVGNSLEGARGGLKRIQSSLAGDNWIAVQHALHTFVIIFGHLVGYMAFIPPNIIMNLAKIEEAAHKLQSRILFEACAGAYALPAEVGYAELRDIRGRVSGIYETVCSAALSSQEFPSEGEDEFTADRPNRWDYVEKKLDRLYRISPVHGYSGSVWVSDNLTRRAKQWLHEDSDGYAQICAARDSIMRITGIDRQIAERRLENLTSALGAAEALV